MSMKNTLTLAGIEPATFRFVAHHLNHCGTAVSTVIYIYIYITVPLTKDGKRRGKAQFRYAENNNTVHCCTCIHLT